MGTRSSCSLNFVIQLGRFFSGLPLTMKKSTMLRRLMFLVAAITVQVDGQIEGNVRLVGGSSSLEGRVEIFHVGVWGTVCDDYWDLADADVVCRQLGFASAREAKDQAYFGQGSSSMTIWLDNVDCTGNEAHLSDCDHIGWGWQSCGHWEDAGVVCSYSPASEGDVRLVDGSGMQEGRVEIYHNYQWGTICSDLWGYEEAKVVCRQLSYGGVSYSKTSMYGPGQGSIHLDNVVCSGYESALLYCSHNGWNNNNCEHRKDVGIKCVSGDINYNGLAGWVISLIVLGSVFAFGLMVAICVGCCCCASRKKRTAANATANTTSSNTSTTQNGVPMQHYPVQQMPGASNALIVTTGATYPPMNGGEYPPRAGAAYPPTASAAYPLSAGAVYQPMASATYPPTASAVYLPTAGAAYPMAVAGAAGSEPSSGAPTQTYSPPPQYSAKDGMPPAE